MKVRFSFFYWGSHCHTFGERKTCKDEHGGFAHVASAFTQKGRLWPLGLRPHFPK